MTDKRLAKLQEKLHLTLTPKDGMAILRAMDRAEKAGEKPLRAARRYLKKRDLLPKQAPPKEAPPKEAPKIDFKKVDLRNLDRASLKGLAADLHAAGVKVNIPFGDDGQPRVKTLEDHELLAKLHDAIASLPTPQNLEMLDGLDPAKLSNVLKHDCLGVYIDLRTAECQACPDKSECAKKFVEHLRGNFKVFALAREEIKVETHAAAVPATVVKDAQKSERRTKKARHLRYKPDTMVAVFTIKNPVDKDQPQARALVKGIMQLTGGNSVKGVSMADLLKTSRTFFEFDEDSCVNELIPHMLKIGVVKLLEDLTPEERKAYDKTTT